MKRKEKSLDSHSGPTAHFGFQEVGINEKSGLVRGVFDSVAGQYDLMNDLMSGGIHRWWKASLIDQLSPRPSMNLLDVAGGTGDIAFRFCDAGGGEVTVCDINRNMVKVGRDRAIDQNRLANINWLVGDAEALPVLDCSFDAYTIAFGLRNVTRIDAALTEAHRVLRPGGRFLCLEFSRVVDQALAGLYNRFSFSFLPALGRAVTADASAYRYLAESIQQFPPQEELATRIQAAGFERVSHRNMTRGVVAIHGGWRI